ncbi:MAG: hypothetical protein NC181_01420 [Clostridium sp.]|nr:hypothetical protein [Clostridium sp.]MCM1443964.1 hypothetical protein [Candidatus Amulumruptor caecigallinarius]
MYYDFTFLSEEEYNKIFKNNSERKADISDFAIILGGAFSSTSTVNNNQTLENRTGYYWTRTPFNGNARVVN